MIVLAVDTVGRTGGVALLSGGARDAGRDLGDAGRHAETLGAATQAILDGAGVSWADLDLVAVNVGPGSFTGIRVGIAFALGLAEARRVPAAGVGCLDIHARACYDATSPAIGSYIVSVSNVKRGEVVLARYRVQAGGPERDGDEARVEVAGGPAVPPPGPDTVLSGDGASLLWPEHPVGRWEASGVQRALATAILARAARAAGRDEAPVPRYARPADARPRRRAT
jgi:tRNA threonylcarbamoyladenosine biosynthesis protein TsaB